MDQMQNIHQSFQNTFTSGDFVEPLTPSTPATTPNMIGHPTPNSAYSPGSAYSPNTAPQNGAQIFFPDTFNKDMAPTHVEQDLGLSLQQLQHISIDELQNYLSLGEAATEPALPDATAPPTPPIEQGDVYDIQPQINCTPYSAQVQMQASPGTYGVNQYDPMFTQQSTEQMNMMPSPEMPQGMCPPCYTPTPVTVVPPYMQTQIKEEPAPYDTTCVMQKPKKGCVGRPIKNDPNEKHLSPQEKAKKLKRREQNRKAASTCRDKKKKEQDQLSKKYTDMEDENSKLRTIVATLENEKRILTQKIEQHKKCCPYFPFSGSYQTDTTSHTQQNHHLH